MNPAANGTWYAGEDSGYCPFRPRREHPADPRTLVSFVENHDELAGRFHDVLDAIETPTFVVRGNAGTLKAARNIARKKWLVVVYREVTRNDGFVITAYTLDSRPKGDIVWPRR